MKQCQVKPGVRALLSLGGRRGAVAVTVIYQCRPERAGDVRWVVEDSSGMQRQVTPRRLQPLPLPTDRHGNAIIAAMRADALKLAPVTISADGQTLTIG